MDSKASQDTSRGTPHYLVSSASGGPGIIALLARVAESVCDGLPYKLNTTIGEYQYRRMIYCFVNLDRRF